MKKVSIIIPVYNTEDYIIECLKSLKKQTYKNLEIIIINDGSRKSCRQTLSKLAKEEKRISLYHFEIRRGVGAARNYGVAQASGEFIYFLDSDDYLPERTLELLVKHIQQFPLIRGRMYTTSLNSSFAVVFNAPNQVKTYDVDKYNLLKNNSAQNFLIRKDYIQQHQLMFSEEVEVYSDLAFMVPALIHVDQFLYVKEALYFRRRRNDPIEKPSLSQGNKEKEIKDFLYMYRVLKIKYHDELARNFLDQQLLNYYRKDIVKYFKETTNQINLFFDDLSEAMKLIPAITLKDHQRYFKKEIMLLANGNRNRYKRVISRHNFLRDFRDGLKSKRKFNNFLYKHFLSKRKKKKSLIVFESFQGRSYSDNPKYIYEYILENDLAYKCVWSVNVKQDIPGNPKQVKRLSLKHFYYLALAKYWVSNSRLPNYLDKPNNTIYLQTWHGTPLKRLAGDMDDVHMPGTNSERYKLNFYNETQKWDYLITPNLYSKEIFKRAFWFDNQMLEVGYPRNDVLYNKNNDMDINCIKKQLNLPIDKKVVLYAPTWRDDQYYSKGNYRFNLKLDLNELQKAIGDDYIIILRMHYFISSQIDISAYEGFVYDFSSYNDIGELYLISDMLITDYSSVFFDYANLKRPILFYTYDLEKYRDSLRGFYIDIEAEVPGPLLKTTEEVIDSIQNIDQVTATYQQKYDRFYERFCTWDDGEAAKKTVQKVFKKQK